MALFKEKDKPMTESMGEKKPESVKFTPAYEFPTGFNSLSEREQKYFKMMNAKSGVLYISSQPGLAKSAIQRSIAKKMGFQYFDIRLSMVDETDVGLFPSIDEMEIDGVKQKMLSHVAPKWAYIANTKPTIIHFEELNRSTLAVRNAALQMLLEREIGAFFKFNSNVLMCASGNLGEEDGTDVEEFDQALNNRLIHIEHQMPYSEWVTEYAEENICPVIIQFLKVHTEYYLGKADTKNTRANKAYATPRSWTFLSDYIFNNYGGWTERLDANNRKVLDADGNPKLFKKFPSVRTWINDIKTIGHGYVGPANVRFIRYCEDSLKITLDDVLNRYDELESDIKNFNRDKKSELLSSMKERKTSNLKPLHIDNLLKFLVNVSEDECVGYVLHVLDNEYFLSDDSSTNKFVEKFLGDKKLSKYRDAIMKHLDDDPKNRK